MPTAPTSLSTWSRLLLGLGLAFLSVALLLLSQPPYGLWPLVFAGFIPMLLAQHRILPERFSSLAPAIGIGGFMGILILGIFGEMVDRLWLFKAMPLLIGLLVFFTERGTRRFDEATGHRWFVLQGALVWVGIEMIRSLVPNLGTGGFIGYAFYRAPWLIQPLNVFGIFGLNLLTMLAAYTLGLGAIALFDRWAPARPWGDPDALIVSARLARRWLGGVGLLWAAWLGLSLALYLLPRETPTVRVAAIQPQHSFQYRSVSPARARELDAQGLEHFSQLTRQAAGQGARLIVWTEGALAYDPQQKHTAELQALARETEAYLAIGYAVQIPQGLRNEATVITPDGEFLGVYGKDHPGTLLGETSLTRGTYPAYRTDFGSLGTIVCWDLNYTDTARKIARNGAQILAVPSNDWPALATRQVAYLVYRAVENRVAAVKADTQYDSLVIDSYGRVVASHITPAGGQAVLVADVPLGAADAPQLVTGDTLGWFSLAGLLFFALPNPLLRRQAAAQPAAL